MYKQGKSVAFKWQDKSVHLNCSLKLARQKVFKWQD